MSQARLAAAATGAADRRHRLRVPPGWEPVAAIALRVWEDREALTDRMQEAIRDGLPAYGPVPVEDLRASMLSNIEMTLFGLAENRGPREHEVRARQEVGRRRAEQGLPADALLRGIHVGYETLWQALTEALPPEDAETATLLTRGAVTFWRWVHDVTEALTAAHAAAVRATETQWASARQRLAELLARRETDSEEVRRLARDLRFDPDGELRVSAVRPAAGDVRAARQLQRALDRIDGNHAVALRGDLLIVLSQGVEAALLAETIARSLPSATTGIGLGREGLGGAVESVTDAELALAIAAPGVPAAFERDWLLATLAQAAPRLQPLLRPGAETAAHHVHLADTVLAFAESGFSVTDAARRLELHANTVAYRLERWHSLTGWDPRTYHGLARSLASIHLAAG